jgi:hypothetical protein
MHGAGNWRNALKRPGQPPICPNSDERKTMAMRELSAVETNAVSGGVVQVIAGFLAAYIAGKSIDGLYDAAVNGSGAAGGGQISDTPAP